MGKHFFWSLCQVVSCDLGQCFRLLPPSAHMQYLGLHWRRERVWWFIRRLYVFEFLHITGGIYSTCKLIYRRDTKWTRDERRSMYKSFIQDSSTTDFILLWRGRKAQIKKEKTGSQVWLAEGVSCSSYTWQRSEDFTLVIVNMADLQYSAKPKL